jgi:hypothetical protein
MSIQFTNNQIIFSDSTTQNTNGVLNVVTLGITTDGVMFAQDVVNGVARFRRLHANGSLSLTNNSTQIIIHASSVFNPGPPGPPGPPG